MDDNDCLASVYRFDWIEHPINRRNGSQHVLIDIYQDFAALAVKSFFVSSVYV